MSLDEIGLVHVQPTAPKFLAQPLPTPEKLADRRRGRPKKKSQDGTQPCKRRRGGGGAWRAYCAVKLSGQIFSKEKVQTLAERYRQLPHGEKEHYIQLGKRGSRNFPALCSFKLKSL